MKRKISSFLWSCGATAGISIIPSARRVGGGVAVLVALSSLHSIHAAPDDLHASACATGECGEQYAETGTASAEKHRDIFPGRYTARAHTRRGSADVYAKADTIPRPQGSDFSTITFGYTRWKDMLTISAPGRAGQQGNVTLHWRVNGMLTASASYPPDYTGPRLTYAGASYRLTVGSAAPTSEQYRLYGHGTTQGTNFLGGARSYTASFVFGQPFAVAMLVQGEADAYTKFGGVCTAAINGVWSGISSVTANGTPVTDYTATSASGTNYTQPILPPQPVVISRRVHNATPYDVPLPLIGTLGVESRSGGENGNHQIVLTFDGPVTYSGASVTSGTGSVANTSGTGTNVVTLDLTGVTNAQRIAVALTGVNYGTSVSDIFIPMGVLHGDANGDGTVNTGDAIQTRSRSGQQTDAANFRSDFNTDGIVNSGDTISVRNRSGTALP